MNSKACAMEWRHFGYINDGTGIDSDCLPETNDVLVFLLVVVNFNWNWKLPVGYFLINELAATGKGKVSHKLFTYRIPKYIDGVDGAAINISTTTILDAKKLHADIEHWFVHPIR